MRSGSVDSSSNEEGRGTHSPLNEPQSILCMGAIIADIVCHVDHVPKPGQGIVAKQQEIHVGGSAFNSANIIRQLGQKCFLFAPVGVGVFSGLIQSELNRRHLSAVEVETTFDCGACICLVEPDGERTMITIPGIDRQYDAAWFTDFDTSDFAMGLASGYEIEGDGGDAIIGFYKANPAIELFYAPGPRIMGVGERKTASINELHPVWHLNDLEALTYSGAATLEDAGRVIAQQCKNVVIITQGGQGSHFFTTDEHELVPSQPVEVVDSIGAGDAHLGAIMAARIAGYTWLDALKFANRVAGTICAIPGASFEDGAFNQQGIRL